MSKIRHPSGQNTALAVGILVLAQAPSWASRACADFRDSTADSRFNLETAVERGKDVQDIDVNRKHEKCVVTCWVMSHFSGFLGGASRACAGFRDSTADSRLKRLG